MKASSLSITCMSTRFFSVCLQSSQGVGGDNAKLTVNVIHPFSARFSFASSSVLLNTEFRLPTGGGVGRPGFLSVRSCLTTGGRCLTDMLEVFKPAGQLVL